MDTAPTTCLLFQNMDGGAPVNLKTTTMRYMNKHKGRALAKRCVREIEKIINQFPELDLKEIGYWYWEGADISIDVGIQNDDAVIVEVENTNTGLVVCQFDARYVLDIRSALKFFNVF